MVDGAGAPPRQGVSVVKGDRGRASNGARAPSRQGVTVVKRNHRRWGERWCQSTVVAGNGGSEGKPLATGREVVLEHHGGKGRLW